ncbi:RNA polymerase sigma factor SigJ [Saccharopolyspora sp. K220]|uniref:RNA polymerase sigma factor SigJ n=1 Tax=Saccharopolyspora soli TaxID=2926618 RepID=UPI001F563EA4|nr:RNA polymerase sigma factor SigJ [Saccharopolyspora soli]MCI2423226.1 RNA polymerase sigma factor SigJ [Saccharopolyspora soli]
MSDEAAEVFEQYRGLLFGVAYRMLGSASEADDVVQETWLRWDRADRSQISESRAYLVRITARVAVDQLRRASARREDYVGPWLPEPLLTTPDVADGVVDEAATGEAVSIAMLVVLETLSPLERAVFVLREAFGLGFGEIATALGRSESAVRQLGHRAREHVHARRPRFNTDRAARSAATERFLTAALGGDLAELMAVLAPDVAFVGDSGGKVRAPRRVLRGANKVARLFAARASDFPAGTVIDYCDVNGEPAAVAAIADGPYAVFVLDVDPRTELVTTIYVMGNPDKLGALAQRGR